MPKHKSQIILSLAPILESGQAGLFADALAGDCIAASCRASIWALEMKRDKSNRMTEDDWIEFFTCYEDASDICLDATRQFSEDCDREKFADTLKKVAAMLHRCPQTRKRD
jgi:hypothetical protein